MKPSVSFVEKKFRQFNTLMFGGRLPEIPVLLSDASRFVGKCEAKFRRNPDGVVEYYDFRLRMNTRLDMSERDLEDVIIHEMIHLFIMWNGLHDSSPHGKIFKALMESVNKTFGRNLTISLKPTAEQSRQLAGDKRVWHVIAVVIYRNGSVGIKVLPRVVPKIIRYHDDVSYMPDIRKVELYMHDNPWFNRYPVSSALKVYMVNESELRDKLSGASLLKIVDGRKIVAES